METIENQYAMFFHLLGYEAVYYENKRLFHLKEIDTYAKLCDEPYSQDVFDTAIKSDKQILLLEGSLSFKPIMLINWGSEKWCTKVILPVKGTKYAPFFFEEWFDVDAWPEEAKIIARCIRNGADLICNTCGSVNDFTITKPSIHYKATCGCGLYITNISENKPIELHFGKYKGRLLSTMRSNDEIQYLQWALAQNIFKGRLKEETQKFLLAI